MEYKNPLGEDKIHTLLLKFSIPAIIGMIVNALYNIIDRMYIGKCKTLDTSGLGALAISFPLMIILIAFGILFGVGGATLFSIKLGEQKKEEAEHALGNTFILLLLFGFLIMIFGELYLTPLLTLFGASAKILPYAVEYMRIIFLGAIFQIISLGMNNFIRADGNPKLAMLTMFLGAGTNILLDPLFIYVFKMGMTGAALATILSQLLSGIWILVYFLGRHSRCKIRKRYLKLNPGIVLKITVLGLPGFAVQIANSLLNTVLNKTLLTYGTDLMISGMGIINSILTFLIMPIIGLNQGVQPIISFNFGAKKFKRVKTAVLLAILAATVTIVLGYLVTRLFPSQLIRLFNDDKELIAFGTKAINIWFLFLPVVGFQIIASNFFQAIGRAKSAMFLTLTRQLILLIPAILIFSRLWGIDGLLYAAPFSDLLSTILTGFWFYFGLKKLANS